MSTIFVTGLPGAGKTTASRILAECFDLRVANVGNLLAEDLSRAGIAVGSRAQLGVVFLQHRPPEAILDLIASAAARGISVFDGVRLFTTCEAARARIKNLSIWNVRAPLEHRCERLRSRLEAEFADREAVAEAIRAHDVYAEENFAIARHADVHVENDTTMAVFGARVERLYASGGLLDPRGLVTGSRKPA